MKKVNIGEELASLEEYWSQKIIGKANGQLFKVAKGIGEVNWHKHDDQDELFILYKGHLTIRLRTENIELFAGDMFVVPKGIEHSPVAEEDVEFLIVGLDITSTEAGGKPAWSRTPNG
jgi:quercetin dioxygenase-like cupin family protein